MFASLPGVSAPPPFGGNQRTVVIRVDPDRLRAYNLSPEEVVTALSTGNLIAPSGNIRVRDQMPIVPVDSLVVRPEDLGSIPVRPGMDVYLRDLGVIEDSTDIPAGWALADGSRAVYILVTKRADASTLAVVNEVRANLKRMQAAIPEDIQVSFDFDQSPYVTGAMWGVGSEALLGAVLTGLMVFLFLRDWRSVIVVVLNIPFALLGAVVALWLTGQTLNLMTLGGLALAVGILVDESTVEVENIHTQFEHTPNIARAVRRGNQETAVPRLLAMLCILAVFIPSFFMQGAAQALFVPLSLAVGFAMVTSYVLSSTFVPVLSVWLGVAGAALPSASRGPRWLVLLRAAAGRLRLGPAGPAARPLGPGSSVPGSGGVAGLARGRAVGAGNLPHRGRRAVPAPLKSGDGNADQGDGAADLASAGGHQAEGRPGQRRRFRWLCRPPAVKLPHQHHLPVD